MNLCLNMIVKNEAARIERCLASVTPWISSYAILDTGSVDGTPEMIRDILGARAISGVVAHGEFVDFSTTRNKALSLVGPGFAEPGDYLLLLDADMELVVEDPAWRNGLAAPAYSLIQRMGGLTYWNVRLLRYGVDARYVGVTHEYLSVPEDPGKWSRQAPGCTGAWFIDHADGANRPDKFTRDIALLETDLVRDPDNARSWYYLGQSYRDSGDPQQAALCYAKAAELSGWEEEKWHAQMSRARALRDA